MYQHFAIFTEEVLEDTVLLIQRVFGVYLDENTPIFRIQFFKERAENEIERRKNAPQ